MVATVIDPIKVPSITLSNEELDEIKAGMKSGELPPDFLERHRRAIALNVFGFDAKQDRHGNYIEQGLGAPGFETGNHFAALKKAETAGTELPGSYDRAIAAIWKRDPKRAEQLRLPR